LILVVFWWVWYDGGMPRKKKKKLGFDLGKMFEVNRLVKFFIYSDLLFMGGWGLIGPIFAIFVVAEVEGATLVTVGAVAGVYWFVKAVVQLPVAMYLDKKEGERDDFHALIFSLLLSGIASFSFVLVESIPMLFLVVAIKAVAFGFYAASWPAIFSRHLDKKRFAFDWSLDSGSIGVVMGLTALVGSAVASVVGFKPVFVFASVLSFAAVLVLLSVPHLILPEPKRARGKALIRDHTPVNIEK
jgi:MFS family permease